MNVGEEQQVDVATGGRPQAALERAVAAFHEGPGLIQVAAFHDTGCPAIGDKILGSCTCEIVVIKGRRLA